MFKPKRERFDSNACTLYAIFKNNDTTHNLTNPRVDLRKYENTMQYRYIDKEGKLVTDWSRLNLNDSFLIDRLERIFIKNTGNICAKEISVAA